MRRHKYVYMAISQMGDNVDVPGQMGRGDRSSTHQMGADIRSSACRIILEKNNPKKDPMLSPVESACLSANLSLCREWCSLCEPAQNALSRSDVQLDEGNIALLNSLQALFILTHARGVDMYKIGRYFSEYGEGFRQSISTVARVHGSIRDLWSLWRGSIHI